MEATRIEVIKFAEGVADILLNDIPATPEELGGKSVQAQCLVDGHGLGSPPNLILGEGLIQATQVKVVGVQAVKREGESAVLRGAEDAGEVVEGRLSECPMLRDGAITNLE